MKLSSIFFTAPSLCGKCGQHYTGQELHVCSPKQAQQYREQQRRNQDKRYPRSNSGLSV